MTAEGGRPAVADLPPKQFLVSTKQRPYWSRTSVRALFSPCWQSQSPS